MKKKTKRYESYKDAYRKYQKEKYAEMKEIKNEYLEDFRKQIQKGGFEK